MNGYSYEYLKWCGMFCFLHHEILVNGYVCYQQLYEEDGNLFVGYGLVSSKEVEKENELTHNPHQKLIFHTC